METQNNKITVTEEIDNWLRSRHMMTYAEGHREAWDEFTYYREDNWPAYEWEIRYENAGVREYKKEIKQLETKILHWYMNNGKNEEFRDLFGIKTNTDGYDLIGLNRQKLGNGTD